MSRKVNFGDYSNKTVSGILDNFFCFFLCIKTAMRSFIVGLGFTVNQCTRTHRTYFRKFGIFLDFNSPALVFGQMPMKIIDIVQCQHINDLFQIRNRKIMAAHVYHETTITETRIVINSSHRGWQRIPVCFWSTAKPCRAFVFHKILPTHFLHSNGCFQKLPPVDTPLCW